jgi:hypothetical protein
LQRILFHSINPSRAFSRPVRRTTDAALTTLMPLRPAGRREYLSVEDFGAANGLSDKEIQKLLTLFGPRATRQELLANATRPTRCR